VPTTLILVVIGLFLPGCTALREVANLRKVDFRIDRVSDITLAGIEFDAVRSFEDLGPMDLLRLTGALTRGEVPTSFTIHVHAHNPAENHTQARLVHLDWTLLLEDRETVSGVVDQEMVIPAGQTRDLPVSISLDLVEFFDRNIVDLAEMALSMAGQGGRPKRVQLRATPIIDTALGPIRYSEPITIVSTTVG